MFRFAAAQRESPNAHQAVRGPLSRRSCYNLFDAWRKQTAMYAGLDLIFRLLAVLAMSFIGLWSIWAGLGRPNWFVRMSVVLGWISLVLVIPAYELLVLFLVQAGVTIAILSAWRVWRSSRTVTAGPDELPSGGRARSRWQYSIRDLLLLTVLVAWLSAMLTRVPAEAWTHSREWLLPAR